MVRNTFGLMFMLTLVGAFLVITGLIGFEPPAHMSLDPDTWRRGTWNDHVLPKQVGLGFVFLATAGIVLQRINRSLASRGQTRK